MKRYKIYTLDEKKGCIRAREKDNIMTLAGRRYILDRVFDTGTHNWNDSQVADIAIGVSTNTNAGTVGPTKTVPVLTTSWNGASASDWKLSEEILRTEGSVRRTGETVFVTGRFSNADFSPYFADYGTGSIPIVEMGLFLSDTEPTSDPLEDTGEEENAMLSRGTMYTSYGTGYWVADPLYKANDGNAISVGYEFSLEVS